MGFYYVYQYCIWRWTNFNALNTHVGDRFQICFFCYLFPFPHTETTIKLIEFRNNESIKNGNHNKCSHKLRYCGEKVLFPANQNKLQEIAIKLKWKQHNKSERNDANEFYRFFIKMTCFHWMSLRLLCTNCTCFFFPFYTFQFNLGNSILMLFFSLSHSTVLIAKIESLNHSITTIHFEQIVKETTKFVIILSLTNK